MKFNNAFLKDNLAKQLGIKARDGEIPSEVAKQLVPVIDFSGENSARLKIIEDVGGTGTLTLNIPKGFKWKIVSSIFNWGSDATVGDRQVHLDIQTKAGDRVINIPPVAVQPANKISFYTHMIGSQSSYSLATEFGIDQMLPLPDLWLDDQFRLHLNDNAGISGSDAISTWRVLILEQEIA